MMRAMQVNEGITLLDKLDEFQSTSYSFAGLSDMLLQFGQQLSGACDIPLVRLFGQSPAGLSATGESDLRMYYDSINAQQEARLRNPYEVLVKVCWRSLFGKEPPKDLEFKFTPLWQTSALDKATIAKTNTDTVTEAFESGLMSKPAAVKDLRGLSKETGLFSNITDEEVIEAENEPPPMPDEVPPGEEEADGDFPKDVKAADAKISRWRHWFGAKDAGNFKESDHPRKDDGKFGEGSGGGEKKEGEAPSEKEKKEPKKPKEMSNGELQKKYESLSKQSSKVTQELIDAGYGSTKPSEMRAKRKEVPLFDKYLSISDKMHELRAEVTARYGPDVRISNLPRGR